MKIMLDTNILISAALFPRNAVAKALLKALNPPYEPVVCDYVVDELRQLMEVSVKHFTWFMNKANAPENGSPKKGIEHELRRNIGILDFERTQL